MVGYIRGKINYFRTHWFVRQAAVLQFGTTFANLLQAFIAIFIARLLEPERYGIYVIAMSLASLLSILLASGFQEAAVSLLARGFAQNDRKEIGEVLSFYGKLIFYCVLITVVALIVSPLISSYLYQNATIGLYASLVVAAALISSTLFSISIASLQVTGEIPMMAFLNIADQGVRWGLSLLLVYLGYGVWGAMAGHFIGAMIIFSVSFFVWRVFLKRHAIFPSLSQIIASLPKAPMRKYFSFSFWIAVDRNVAMLYFILPVLIAGVFIGASEVGYFKLAFGYLNIAMTVLVPISLLLNVLFPKMKVGQDRNLRSNFIKVTLYSTALSTVVTAIIILIAPVVFQILYGPNYLPSVPYVRAFLIYGALFGIGVGLGPMWRAIQKVKVSILINTIVLIAGIPLSIFLMKHFGGWGAVFSVTLLVTISHLISFFYLAIHLKKISYEPA
ncbi:MAG: Membrane protein [Candidatus Nomurabacteria bacterium GW2011_GWA1_46_11]|uniref:Membrane protein n=1 Tax=Candidatus Nomurabacteria bacterium GW2011_GWA1_46_11 TaxID=1618732 RepID=A0A0G1NN12_9BACT|nr:MAG: Membrane protein [Candidatus Nomurabacteria bacterium GW2011_GWA1_46_11]